MKRIFISFIFVTALASCKKENQETPVVESTPKDTLALDYKALGMDEKALPEGVNVGDSAPEITMTTSENKQVNLKYFYNKQPVVVIFYRGYWCPVCNEHLTEFAERAKEIEAKGAQLIAISSESYANVSKTVEQTGANFTIISDIDGSIMKAFDVNFEVLDTYEKWIQEKLDASIAETNATKKAVLPVPATFIIDTTGKIIYKQFDPNYRKRASIDDILANLPQ